MHQLKTTNSTLEHFFIQKQLKQLIVISRFNAFQLLHTTPGSPLSDGGSMKGVLIGGSNIGGVDASWALNNRCLNGMSYSCIDIDLPTRLSINVKLLIVVNVFNPRTFILFSVYKLKFSLFQANIFSQITSNGHSYVLHRYCGN